MCGSAYACMNHLTCHTLNSGSIDVAFAAALDALPSSSRPRTARPFPVWLPLHPSFDPKKPAIRLLKMALERHERDTSLACFPFKYHSFR